MMDVIKSEEELSVPLVWRRKISLIVNAIVNGNIGLHALGPEVKSLSEAEVSQIRSNIVSYGDVLVSLSEIVWDTSVYQWMGSWWEVLVDLSTSKEACSDLVMFVTVRECEHGYCFVVDSIHVP